MPKRLIEEVEEYNRKKVELYRWKKASRDEQRKAIGVNVDCSACADGRHFVGEALGLLDGIVSEHPSIGAILDPGWQAVRDQIYRSYKWCVSQSPKIRSVFLATYHFSRGGHGNCAGHNDNIQASISSAFTLRNLLTESCDPDFYLPIVVGFDTDTDAAIFHAVTGDDKVDVLDHEAGLADYLYDLYNGCQADIVQGIINLAASNRRHAEKFLENPRSSEQVSHNENGIVVGIGAGVSSAFPRDWCLRVGAYSDDISGPLAKAAGIIAHNREEGNTAKGQRSLLLCNGVYFEESGPDALFAKREAIVLAQKAKRIVLEAQPSLQSVLDIAAGVVYHHDRSLTIFNRSV